MKNHLMVLFFLSSLVARAAEPVNSDDTNDVLSRYSRLSPEQLLDTAAYHESIRENETALVCYSLIVNTPEIAVDNAPLRRLKIDALNRSSVIFYYWSDYVKAYELLDEAMELQEATPYREAKPKTLTNIGNVYYRLGEYRIAKRYYSEALKIWSDSMDIISLYNNIGAAEMELGELDSASLHIENSLRMSRESNKWELSALLHTAASIAQKRGSYDTAYRYFEMGLEEARAIRAVESEAANLLGMGDLLFETGDIEAAESRVAASNAIARRNNLNDVSMRCHLLLSKMERSRGRYREAMEHSDRYNGLRDSLLSADKLANINQLQRIGDISKANRQIESLALEQAIRERTINYQKIILSIGCAVLFAVVAVLSFVFSQKRKLNRAYRSLVEKSHEIVELQDGSGKGRYKNTPYSDDDGALMGRILAIMEDTEVICNPKFSINMLSSLVEANHTYVSQVINATMNKNFRSFLNEYRIREAQRLLSRSDAVKFTLESISLQLGYKSQNTFRAAFQEITGVTPGFYLKSIRETVKE